MLGGAIRVSTPFLFVSLGECLTEHIGPHQSRPRGHAGAGRDERLRHLLPERLAVARRARRRRSPALLLGALHAGICQLPRVNDIAVGIALMLFGTGLAFFLGKPLIQPKAPHLPAIDLGWLERHPAGPRGAAGQRPVPGRHRARAVRCCWALRNTRWGLILRTGRRKRGCRARDRLLGQPRAPARDDVGGFLAGIGGSFLSLYLSREAGTRACRAARA